MRIANRQSVAYGAVAGLAVLAGTAALRAGGEPKPSYAPVAFRPIQPLEQLMDNQDLVFKQAKAAIVDGKWPEARSYAWLLAELANVNRQHARSAAYADFAGSMAETCVQFADTLKRKDSRQAAESVSRIARICESCHDQFRRKK